MMGVGIGLIAFTLLMYGCAGVGLCLWTIVRWLRD